MKAFQLLIYAILYLGSITTKAQGTFNRAYDIDSGLELGAAISILDDGYLLFGTGSASINDFTYILKVAKLDTAGNLLWTKKYGAEAVSFSINYLASGLTIDNSGNYYASGVFGDTVGQQDLLVTKINDEGDTLWTRSFGGPGQEVGYSIYYDSTEQHLYVTGGSASFGPGLTNVAVWVLDTMGNTISTRFYGGGDYDYGRSIVKIEDTLYVSGYTSSYGKETEPFLMKLDTAGNVADLRFYGTNGQDSYAGLNTNATNDRLVMWGRLDTLQKAVFISQLDLTGEVIWRKVLNWFGFVYQAKFLSDNSLIVVGTSKGNPVNGSIIKLDSLGNVLWSRKYYFNDPDISSVYSICYLYDFEVEEQNGNILCFGNTLRNPAIGDSTGSDFWLLKLDNMGCLVPGCDTITEVGIQPIETTGAQVTVYPNPATYKATVLLNHGTPNAEIDFTLFGLSGQAIITQKHSLNPYGFGEWAIDLAGLPPGLYLYRIGSGGKAVNGKLLVE